MKLRWIAALLSATMLASAAGASSEEPTERDIQVLVDILAERGVISQEDASRIVDGNASYEKRRSWLDRIEFSGDFRARYEHIDFARSNDRDRLRYRLRFGASAEINDYLDLVFRLATGSLANSRNATLGGGGGNGSDFSPDEVFIDQAYLTLHALEALPPGAIPALRKFDLLFGKMKNPFQSKIGKDLIVWDGDLTPEGLALRWLFEPCDCFSLGIDAAYYVLDENSGASDPSMLALQLDGSFEAYKGLVITESVSLYSLQDLDDNFFDATANRSNNSSFFGNVQAGGLSGLTHSGDLQLLDSRTTLRYSGFAPVGVTLYGRYLRNLSAQRVGAFGRSDTAWSAGLELDLALASALGLGDPDHPIRTRIGAAYFRVEANALPSSLTDSDLFDGHTNAHGWAFYLSRRVLPNTKLGVTAFLSEEIDATLPSTAANLSRFDRFRIDVDAKVAF